MNASHPQPRRTFAPLLIRLLPPACCLLLLAGCSPSDSSSTSAPGPGAADAQRKELSHDLFAGAVEALNRLDDYDESRADSAVEQVVRRLNESLESGLIDGKQGDPYTVEDGKVLREVVWLREAAEFAVGDASDALVRAERLFDWTIRNVQLIGDEPPTGAGAVDERLPYLPWHVLVLGRGSALDRAWVFALLARQQGLDVVLLGPPDAKPGAAGAATLAALVHDEQLHLFDARWGTALPGRDGRGIATLKQVQTDDALLRALDLETVDGPQYPLTADAAQKLVAYYDASSTYRAAKFARLESLLSGDSKLVLSIDEPGVVARIKKSAGAGEARPWPLRDERFPAGREKAAFDAILLQLQPFRSVTDLLEPAARQSVPDSRLANSPIWPARVRHLSGKYVDSLTGKPTLARHYQESRFSLDDLKQFGAHSSLWNYYYRVRQNATYWLGLVSYDLKNYDTAKRYFELILAEEANGGWTAGARYNLGRSLEALNEPQPAGETYRKTYFGVKPDPACLYRAKRIAAAAKS